MKKRWSILLSAVAVALFLAALLLFFCQPTVAGHAEDLTDEEIFQQLMELEPRAFRWEIALFFANLEPDSERGLCWLQALFNRPADFSDRETIRKFLAFIPVDEDFAGIWLGIYQMNHPENNSRDPRLWAFLRDPAAPPGWKGAVVGIMAFETEKDLILLRQFSQHENHNLRLSAFRRLEELRPSIGLDQAWQLIEDYPQGDGTSIVRAIDTVTRYLTSERVVRGDYWNEQKRRLLAVCRQVLQSDPSLSVKNALLYDMQLLSDWEALQMAVESPEIDRLMKQAMIAHNYYVLEEALLDPKVSAEEIRFAADCMRILPIQDLGVPLEAALAAQAQAFAGEEAKELAALLDTMREKGVKAKTWLKED